MMRLGVMQEVVSFVDENAMRKPGPSTHRVQRRKHRSNVLHLLIVGLV
jgi:hypothetical protein